MKSTARKFYDENWFTIAYSTYRYRIKKWMSFEEAWWMPSKKKPNEELASLKDWFDNNNQYEVPWDVFRNRRWLNKKKDIQRPIEQLLYPYTKSYVDKEGRDCVVCWIYKKREEFKTKRRVRTYCKDCIKWKK